MLNLKEENNFYGKILQIVSGVNVSKNAVLALEDGTIFHGKCLGFTGISVGEVVFNTSMTGYQEILTDPSYKNQIVAFTYPHIGNTGCNKIDEESNKLHLSGLIIRDENVVPSSWRSENSLNLYLKKSKIVGISDIDTRALTRHLRINGSMKGCISTEKDIDEDYLIEKAQNFEGIKNKDLAQIVSTKNQYSFVDGSFNFEKKSFKRTDSKYHIVVYDFGVKKNILRMLVDRNCKLTIVNAKTPFSEVIKMDPDGIFLSNGPGDPEPCSYAINNIKEILSMNIPVFGICLGHQLLAIASGAKTVKMKFGHHGANHPVQDLQSGEVLITSQNHGFSVSDHNIPNSVVITHRSLFDNSIQGIKIKNKKAFSFQGHPEASPGPHDVSYLFDKFIKTIKS